MAESEASWAGRQDFHVYEREYLASHPKPAPVFSIRGNARAVGASAAWEIGLLKARMLDFARERLLRKQWNARANWLGDAEPQHETRTVDGVEGVRDADIRL